MLISLVKYIFLIFLIDDHLPQATTLSFSRVVAYGRVDCT